MPQPRRAAYQGTLPTRSRAVLVAGTKVVASTTVTDNSNIMLSVQQLGTVTTPQAICVSARIPGQSFTILSAANNDTSVVAYTITEP